VCVCVLFLFLFCFVFLFVDLFVDLFVLAKGFLSEDCLLIVR
jgi:hypothetical protein